tara:strand:- start:39 stop:341 length:303 start_codon:yes stop_codon:yes gene_type:complete
MAHKIVNGVQVELTAAEVTAMEEQAVAWEAGAYDRAMADLRSKRNRLLAASDWTQLTDTTLTSSEKSQWMNYRTELRNLTNGITTVEQANNVAMPTIPNG